MNTYACWMLCVAVLIAPAAAAQEPGAAAARQARPPRLTIAPETALACAGGDDVIFTAKRGGKAVPVRWTLDTTAGGTLVEDGNPVRNPVGESVVFVPAPPDADRVARYGSVAVGAAEGDDEASATITLGGLCDTDFGGEIARAALGFEQVGAAGVESTQKYSFDFFISRPFPLTRRGGPPGAIDPGDYFFGPRSRWWGEVRIGSYPQEVTSEASGFAGSFVTTAGKLKVNELVQTAEFTTGLEYRVAQFPQPRQAGTESSRQRFALMAFGGLGAVGPFTPPDELTVFQVPPAPAAGAPAGSAPQHDAFRAAFPDVRSRFVAFRPKAADQFLEHYMGGLRLYTFYADDSPIARPLAKAPASVELSVGRNNLIAPEGWAWHAAAYYPFPLGDRTRADTMVIYLFGQVWMKFGGATFDAPRYQLAPATENGQPVPLTHSEVAIVATDPNPRDTYRLGVSLDLIKVWERLTQTDD